MDTLIQSPIKKAVFLDRDGVINSNRGRYYTWKAEDMELNPGLTETLKALKERGFMLLIITNQGGVSRGEYSRNDVEKFHQHLNLQLEKEGAAVDDFYYCPHHSDLENCLCRKPQALMIRKAMARYGIDPDQSWMIGDSHRDIEAGEAAGLKTILVESNGDLRTVIQLIVKPLDE
ncbi:MAG: HAD family hydrolase [Bacteroidetes bacterium]|nr:HAD family hydrolase [Bacteroidota bacterium]